jgi:hypothetical protein
MRIHSHHCPSTVLPGLSVQLPVSSRDDIPNGATWVLAWLPRKRMLRIPTIALDIALGSLDLHPPVAAVTLRKLESHLSPSGSNYF